MSTAVSPRLLHADELARALTVRDLSDPAQGPHAVQLVVDTLVRALAAAWRDDVRVVRAHPLVPVEDNYERLGYPPDAVTRDARYTRYASQTCMLRSHTSAVIPPTLRELARQTTSTGRYGWHDVLLACPGLVYRRDVVDRLHTGTPHQLDLWRVVTGRPMDTGDLDEMIAAVVTAALPGLPYRAVPASHPYTSNGRQVDVQVGGEWIEIAECGLAARRVLTDAGLDHTVSGLAMGLGLDRLLMLRKGIPDIRLLTSADARIADQMLDLAPYRAVSKHPPISRDLSVAVPADADAETLGGAVRDALGAHADAIEEIRVVAETPVEELPRSAVERLGALPGQKNVLLRIVLRDPARTMSDQEANALRDRVYAAVHRGGAHQWAGPPPRQA
ncbi:PheS-related mystery ligase SrmL [Nonomuraea sp. NPDC003727]